jgi:endonuclease-3
MTAIEIVAFARLLARYPTWEAVRDAPAEEVIEAIRRRAWRRARVLAFRACYAESRGEGRAQPRFLHDMPFEEARPGCATSTRGTQDRSDCAAVFAWPAGISRGYTHSPRHPAFGPDSAKTSREAAHDLLEALVPVELTYPLHLEIPTWRSVCQARRPRCEACVLQDLCDDFKARTAP